MRKTWKLLTFAALLCLSLGIAACNGGSVGSADPVEDPAENVVIVLEAGTPSADLGKTGDVCLVAETGAFYRKTESGWEQTTYERYDADGSTLTVTYSDGSTGTYAMAASEETDCAHEGLAEAECQTIYPAKCVIPGIGVKTCPACHESFPEILPATGEHRYGSGGYTCLDCGVTDYFKDAALDGSGRYVIQDMRDVPFADGEIVIPGMIDGHEVVVGKQAFGDSSGGNPSLKSVVIGEGVKEIGGYAFQGCSELESVVLPESLTVLGADPDNGTLYTNYNSIFADCTSLKSVTFKGDVTVIGNRTFYDCSSLSSIDFPDSLREIGSYAFQNTGLTSVTIPADLKLGLDVFEGCSALTSVEFKGETVYGTVGNPKKDCAAISNGCFKGCTNLAEITLPEGIEEIGSSAFESCSSLTKIEIPANVTTIGDKAFQNCNSIASLTFGEGSKLKSIGLSAFYCGGNDKPANDKLQTIVFPEGLETIGKTAFGYCIALENIVLPSTMTSLGSEKFDAYFGPFYKTTKLTNVFYSGSEDDWTSKVQNHDKLQFGDKLVYFSAEPQPGCWHWNGAVPSIWE